MHIALVTHPIENGQGNFEPVTNEESVGISLAMSQLTEPLSMSSVDNDHQVGAVKTKSGIQDMLEALRAVMIDLPDDTHEVNFMERLLVALRQKKASENPEDSSISNPPEGAKEQPAPVAMSQEKENLEQGAGVASNEEAVLSHPTYKAASKTIEFLMSHLNGQEKDKLSARRDALVKSGKISEDYASKHLDSEINEFQMSFGDDGSVKVCPASTIMEALEASPSLTTGIISGSDSDQASLQQIGLAMSQSGTTGLPQGYQEEGNPNEVGGPSAEEIALEFLSNTGHAG